MESVKFNIIAVIPYDHHEEIVIMRFSKIIMNFVNSIHVQKNRYETFLKFRTKVKLKNSAEFSCLRGKN